MTGDARLADATDGLGPTVLATGVTDASSTLATHGAMDTVLPLASVTKPLAAYGVLVAVDQGRVALDDDVTGDGRTVAQLLAHASGLPPEAGGPTTAAARRRIYSNHAYELLGEHVANATGRPFSAWLHAQVLVPLGMYDTSLDGSPAKDATGTASDLLTFVRELLAPTLVEEDDLTDATRPWWPELDGVLPGYGRQSPNLWGLGFELRGAKAPHWTDATFPATVFGHFGQSGSFIWVSPTEGIAGVFLGNLPFGPWAVDGWPSLTATQRAIAMEESV